MGGSSQSKAVHKQRWWQARQEEKNNIYSQKGEGIKSNSNRKKKQKIKMFVLEVTTCAFIHAVETLLAKTISLEFCWFLKSADTTGEII